MKQTKIFMTIALTLLVGAAACDEAQEGESAEPGSAQPGMQQEMDPEAMGQMIEIQQIQQRLEPISQQALQDEELTAEMLAIQTRMQNAMREEDAELADRMESVREELVAAQQAGDQERVQEIMSNSQALQTEFQALQAKVFERPEIRESIDDFEAKHRERMIEIDPEAEPLLDRLDELVAGLPSD